MNPRSQNSIFSNMYIYIYDHCVSLRQLHLHLFIYAVTNWCISPKTYSSKVHNPLLGQFSARFCKVTYICSVVHQLIDRTNIRNSNDPFYISKLYFWQYVAYVQHYAVYKSWMGYGTEYVENLLLPNDKLGSFILLILIVLIQFI